MPSIGFEEVFISRGFMSASSALPLPTLVDWRPSSSSTSGWRPFPELGAGTSHLPIAKWFVPGDGLQVAGFWLSPSVEKDLDWIAFSFFFPGSFV
jgi:hypothetical protein